METTLTPLEFARRTRRLHADREAVVDGPKRFSYRQFFERCDRFSSALLKLGVVQGDRVAYLAPNTHQNLEGYYAVPQIGAVIVPMNYRLTADDFAYLIKHSGARVVCVDRDHLDAIDSVRDQLAGVIAFVALENAREGWLDYETLLAQSDAGFERPAIAETDLLSINYTSGTTSRPKGVMITHRNAALNMVGTMLHMHLGVHDRYLWTLPMFHANGWTHVWIMTAVGGTHVCLRKVDAPGIFERIASERISYFCAAPTVLIAIANAPESLRKDAPRGLRVMTAGAPPAAATIERIEGDLGWSVAQIYGLTETAPFSAFLTSEWAISKLGSAGQPPLYSDTRIVDGDNRELAPGERGEICLRGPNIMKGYWNRPDATAEAIDAQGWFHSGDVGYVDEDGFLFICDRLKDMVISGGENVYPAEVESVLYQHEYIAEVAVIGVPDTKWGEAVTAVVALHEGRELTIEALREFAEPFLARYKLPSRLHIVAALPRNPAGKVLKFALKEELSG